MLAGGLFASACPGICPFMTAGLASSMNDTQPVQPKRDALSRACCTLCLLGHGPVWDEKVQRRSWAHCSEVVISSVAGVGEERGEMDESSWEQGWHNCVQRGGISGVGLIHPQVSLRSWWGRRRGWSAAFSKSHASELGAKLSLQAVPAARVWRDVGTTSSELPSNGKREAMVAMCHCWFFHTWGQAHLERWAWIEKSSALWYIIHGSVQKVGSNSCWWQKLQLCALFLPNGFWEQRGSNPKNNDTKSGGLGFFYC